MNYKILVIDDDEPIHIMTKNFLGKEFATVHARNVQEAIDILSESAVNLILSDIHMPGISGLEFLESLRADKEKNNIPVLIMTNLPTVEKEQKAMNLGAADFIAKELFNSDKEKVLEVIRMKIVSDVHIKGLEEDLNKNKDKLVMKVMEKALDGSFTDTAETVCSELSTILKSDFTGFWSVKDGNSTLVNHAGEMNVNTDELGPLTGDDMFKQIEDTKSAYFTNHIYNEDQGFFIDYSREHNLSAEIGIPLFAVNERMLLMNNMKVPEDAPLFGIIIAKRSKLFSSDEFELTSRLITQTGSILYRLYANS